MAKDIELDRLQWPVCLTCLQRLGPGVSFAANDGPMEGPAPARVRARLCAFAGRAPYELCSLCGGGTIAGVYLDKAPAPVRP